MNETQPAFPKVNAIAENNRFFILGVFDDSLNKEIIVPLTRVIDEQSRIKGGSIEFYITSQGGNGWIAMHIIRLMELARAKGVKVRTIVPHVAFSAGSMVAIAGDPGERYIGFTAEHCVHYGTMFGYQVQTPLQVEREGEYKKRWFNKLLNHYKKYSKIPKLEEKIKDDNFFIPADDCIKWGLADKYMDEL